METRFFINKIRYSIERNFFKNSLTFNVISTALLSYLRAGFARMPVNANIQLNVTMLRLRRLPVVQAGGATFNGWLALTSVRATGSKSYINFHSSWCNYLLFASYYERELEEANLVGLRSGSDTMYGMADLLWWGISDCLSTNAKCTPLISGGYKRKCMRYAQ